ncbi:MAG TPA: 50S ribosomal protein L10, partial [Clostridiales bacterium]|nr:50S ribosomal protein L10 [Clostridiales bacterium]
TIIYMKICFYHNNFIYKYADVTKLRTDLRNAKADYKVIKNNIIKRALEANGESGLNDLLEGPTALIMGEEDYLEPLKAIYGF